ncbi:MAG: hypothetical protein L3K19_02300 [Thermoplasmata archaeon]|nr:hypothetical protein [Thermoplasmata archaeon]
MSSRRRRLAIVLVLTALVISAPGAGPGVGVATGSAPALPVGVGNHFIEQLEAPVLASGGSGSITFVFADPMKITLGDSVVTLSVYDFNAYPGNATQGVPGQGGVQLLNGSGDWGPSATVPIHGPIPPNGTQSISIEVQAPGNSPAGTFGIRVQAQVVANGTVYLLQSRGYFSASVWASATTGPNGSSTLNLTRLGVSGVLPETAVLVEPASIALPLYGILGASVALAAVGAYFVWRRGPGSSSASRGGPGASNAERALGKRRTREGD